MLSHQLYTVVYKSDIFTNKFVNKVQKNSKQWQKLYKNNNCDAFSSRKEETSENIVHGVT